MRSMLIVARSALWRDVLAARLEHEGYAVAIAGDGPQAVAALTAGPVPGAILLDTTLPKKEWYRVRSLLDRDVRFRPIRRLFVVAALGPSSVPQSGPVFEKPVDPEHVARALRALYPDMERTTAASSAPRRAPDYLDQVIDSALAN
jgi:CheY-like chemotaxis protein